MSINRIIIIFLLATMSFETFLITKDEKIQQKKIATKKPAYPCPGKMLKNMNIEELESMLEYAQAIKDKELAFKTFYYLLSISTDQIALREYKLKLADYCFEIEDYEKAATTYEEFCMLYPGAPQLEYAQYKSILCSFFLGLSSDRDQTITQRTITLIEIFWKKAKDQKFIDETKQMYTTCRQKLFEHEVHVFETYLKQEKCTGAQMRIDYIEKNFKDIKNIEQYLNYLKRMLTLVKDPQTRPVIIQFQLQDALVSAEKQKTTNPSMLKKIRSFFLA